MERLDVTLVRRGLCPSRERAQESIRAGCVLVNGETVSRPSTPVGETDAVEVTGDPIGFVGRGGLKLEAALARFGLDPSGLACLDVGASTGGFTDCLLRRGARRVFAVDVGRDQLHPDLLSDTRVVSMEQTDIRQVETLPVAPELAVVDVSFIPLALVLPAVHRLLAPAAPVVVLIKPQFEVGAGRLGKGGIVKDPAAREHAREAALARAVEIGFTVEDRFESPVVGTEGNREYLALLRSSRL
jgi:23S rRNA (cytidine1920-2'-O)/16S rRNA (cytidine1409-2'-O)-methyltransferase